MKDVVVFSSFEEYKKILNLKIIKNSYAIVTHNNKDMEQNFNLLKLLFNVDNYDGLLNEIVYKLRIRKIKHNLEKEIQELKKMSIINKIDFKLYRTGNEYN